MHLNDIDATLQADELSSRSVEDGLDTVASNQAPQSVGDEGAVHNIVSRHRLVGLAVPADERVAAGVLGRVGAQGQCSAVLHFVLKDELFAFNDLAQKLRKERFENGAVSFEREEVKFLIDDNGKPLEAIIKDLVQAGIVKGVRGKGGGYKLNMKPEECTAWDVIHATEDNFVTVSCVTMENFNCPQKSECRTMPMWTELDKTLKEFFSKYTIKELLESGTY